MSVDIEYDASAGPPEVKEILHDFGYFGHYLHVHAGGRGGKQFILTTLHKSGGQLTQRELYERSHISSAALSEVLSKLECGGLIERRPYESDRRMLTIELTEAGTVMAERYRSERELFEREALECLSQEELIWLKDVLDRLVNHWKHLEAGEVEQ